MVRYEFRRGKGNVVRRMFAEVDAKCYIMVDGDDTYPAEAARQMVRKCVKNRQIWWLETDCHPHILRRINVPFTIWGIL